MTGRCSILLFPILILILIACSFPPAFAIAPGKTVEWNPAGSPGSVSLDGKVHAEKGIKCMDCHNKIWPMKKGADMKMADMDAGKYCGSCHNGEKAFSTKDQANCTKCHRAQK